MAKRSKLEKQLEAFENDVLSFLKSSKKPHAKNNKFVRDTKHYTFIRITENVGKEKKPKTTTYIVNKTQPLLGKGGFGEVRELHEYNSKNQKLQPSGMVAKYLITAPLQDSAEAKLLKRHYRKVHQISDGIIVMPHFGKAIVNVDENGNDALIEEIRTASFEQRIDYIVQTLLLLNQFHHYTPSTGAPVVHRDLKPQNIFLNGNTITIGDLGSAKILKSEDDRIIETEDLNSNLVGTTPGFTAPEVYAGQYGVEADIDSTSIALNWFLNGNIVELKGPSYKDFRYFDFQLFAGADPIPEIPQLIDNIDIKAIVNKFAQKMHLPDYKARPHSAECLMFFKALLDLCRVVRTTKDKKLTEEDKHQQYLLIAKLQLMNAGFAHGSEMIDDPAKERDPQKKLQLKEEKRCAEEKKKYLENLADCYDIDSTDTERNTLHLQRVAAIADGSALQRKNYEKHWRDKVKILEIKEQLRETISEIQDCVEAVKCTKQLLKDKSQDVEAKNSFQGAKKKIIEHSNKIWCSKNKDMHAEILRRDPILGRRFDNANAGFLELFPEAATEKETESFRNEEAYKVRMVKHDALQLIQARHGFFNSKENNKLLEQGMKGINQAQSVDGVLTSLKEIQEKYQPRSSLFVLLEKFKNLFTSSAVAQTAPEIADSKKYSTSTAKEIAQFTRKLIN